jgi:hypothetical protein
MLRDAGRRRHTVHGAGRFTFGGLACRSGTDCTRTAAGLRFLGASAMNQRAVVDDEFF